MSFTVAQVRRRRCCLCVPVRWAVLALSLIAATGSAILAINSCVSLIRKSASLESFAKVNDEVVLQGGQSKYGLLTFSPLNPLK
jgi:hypothetical protein